MAGRQFSFFLGPSDQLPFEEALRELDDIVFLIEISDTPTPIEINTSEIEKMGKERLGLLIVRRADVDDIILTKVRSRDEFYCDPTFEPVIEFSRCYVTNRFIRAGRLYRIDKYWGDDGKLVSKSPEFIEWGERLYKLAKSSLTKVEQGCFAGAEALAMRQAGVAFEGLDIALGSIRD